MADQAISIAASYLYSGATTAVVEGGEAITQLALVYKDPTTNKYMNAITTSAITANASGIAWSPCPADGNHFVIVKRGGIYPGAAVVLGESFFVSANSGKLAAAGDVANPQFVTQVGVGKTTTRIELDFNATGVQRAV